VRCEECEECEERDRAQAIATNDTSGGERSKEGVAVIMAGAASTTGRTQC